MAGESMAYLRSAKDAANLLKNFNKRDPGAFNRVYDLFYGELTFYATRLYAKTTVDAADVIHDVFLRFWQSSRQEFNSLDEVKMYLYVSIKNSRKTLSSHQKHIDKYANHLRTEREQFKLDVIDSEIFSIFNYAMGLLPEDTAKIFRLFFEGWKAEEIAREMGKTTKAIYNIKSRTLAELKRKLPKDYFALFCLLGF